MSSLREWKQLSLRFQLGFLNDLYLKGLCFQSPFAVMAHFVSTEPQPPCGDRFMNFAFICVCKTTAEDFVETELVTQERIIILNGAHLVPQMVLAVLLRSHRSNLKCYYYHLLVFSSIPHVLLYCLIHDCSSRPFPAAWAPANSSPVALHHTNPPSEKRWRFIVCWLWISTPLKVRWSLFVLR